MSLAWAFDFFQEPSSDVTVRSCHLMQAVGYHVTRGRCSLVVTLHLRLCSGRGPPCRSRSLPWSFSCMCGHLWRLHWYWTKTLSGLSLCSVPPPLSSHFCHVTAKSLRHMTSSSSNIWGSIREGVKSSCWKVWILKRYLFILNHHVRICYQYPFKYKNVHTFSVGACDSSVAGCVGPACCDHAPA
jgi:hypothetical protein